MFDTFPAVTGAERAGSPVDLDLLPGAVLALQCEVATGRADEARPGELLDLVEAADRLARWATGLRTRAIASYADRSTGAGSTAAERRFVPDELGLALRVPRLHAQSMIADAQRLAHVLPDTLDALCDGRIDERRADALSFATRVLPDHAARAVEAAVLPHAAGATLRQQQDRTRRAIHRVDPDGEHRRHRVARTDRRVTIQPREDGMASLWVLGAAADSEASFTMLTRLAHAVGADDGRTLDQRRSDLLHQLVQGRLTVTDRTDLERAVARHVQVLDPCVDATGSATSGSGDPRDAAAGSDRGPGDHATAATADHATSDGTGATDGPRHATDRPPPGEARSDALVTVVADVLSRRPQVTDTVRKPVLQIVVGLDTLLGVSDRPGEIIGHGPVVADAVRALADDATGKRLVTDPLSGELLDHGRRTYVPPAALADHVRARDQVCRGPLCTRRARDSELDHFDPWTGGAGTTSDDNLHALCPHHHRLKDAAGWHVLASPDGGLTWISPAGRTHTTEPFDYRAFTDPLPSPVASAGPTGPTAGEPVSPATASAEDDDDPPPF